MPGESRKLRIRLEGGPADEGRLPLSELLRVGRQVHGLVRDVATVLLARPVGRPGRVQGFIERATALDVIASPSPGSFVLDLELQPEPPRLDDELEGLELEPDLGRRALDHLVSGLAALDEKTTTLPPGFDRVVLKEVEKLRPTLRTGITAVTLERPEHEPSRARIDAERLAAASRLIREPVTGPAVAEGKLEMVDRAKLACRIGRFDRPSIACSFPDRMREQVGAALGKHVRIAGEGRFSPESNEPDRVEVESVQVIAIQERLDIEVDAFARQQSVPELAEQQTIHSADRFLTGGRLDWMDDEEAAEFLSAAKGRD